MAPKQKRHLSHSNALGPRVAQVKCDDCEEFLTKLSQVNQAGHALAGSGQPQDPIKLVSVTIETPEETKACNRRQLEGASALIDEQSWHAEWTRRIECWWTSTPYQSGLQACLGALGLTLGSRFDAFFNRPRKPVPAQAGCEALMKQVEMELPEFPTVGDTFKWTVPAIPRLLPNWGRLHQLQSWNPRPEQKMISGKSHTPIFRRCHALFCLCIIGSFVSTTRHPGIHHPTSRLDQRGLAEHLDGWLCRGRHCLWCRLRLGPHCGWTLLLARTPRPRPRGGRSRSCLAMADGDELQVKLWERSVKCPRALIREKSDMLGFSAHLFERIGSSRSSSSRDMFLGGVSFT